MNRLLKPRSTSAISSGLGLVLGSSLILMFLNQHSAPSDSRREVALARLAFADAAHFLAVDVQLDDAVVGLDAVMVPFAAALAAVFARQAALRAIGMRPVGLAVRAPDAEEVAVAGGGDFALFVLVGQIDKHLHLDAARVPRALRGHRIAPDKEAGVADFLLVDCASSPIPG